MARALATLVLCLGLAGCSVGGDDDAAPAVRRAVGLPQDLAAARLVFSREGGTFVARADGADERRVLDLPGVFEFQADVSPDGSRVLLRVDDPGAKQGTWLADMETGRARRVDAVLGGAADWAPDGRRFVLTGSRPGDRFHGLYVVERGRARRITPDRWEAQYPAWSPTGEWIAFTRVTPPNGFDVWLVRADGTALRRLTADEGSDNYAAWSPDGRTLVYSSEDRSDENGLWLMGADGSGKHFLAEGGEPQWEPGDWILYDCPVADDVGHACAIRADGSGAVMLPLGEAAFPNWLPE